MTTVLPPEIWRSIFRDATASPTIDDITATSLSSVSESSEAQLQAAHCDALRTKSALSLTSRAFHALAEEFLCEWIVVRQIKQLPTVGALLTGGPEGIVADQQTKAGWWCRRLELHFAFSMLSSANMSTLHAILSACPRLAILVCASPRPAPPSTSLTALISGQLPSQPAFHLPPALLVHVATACPALRRIEFTGRVKMRLHSLEDFFSRMPALEVARFDGVTDVGARDALPSDALVLPSLHTLHIADVPPTLHAYSLPALHTLSLGFPTRNPSLSAVHLSVALTPHAQTLRDLRITDPFSPLGPLALSLAAPLPHLSHLTFELHYSSARLAPSQCPANAFPALTSITITRANGSWATTYQVTQALENVLELKQAGKMGVLSEVRVCDGAEPQGLGGLEFTGSAFVARFAALGVELVVRTERSCEVA